jgi:glycosyltransferase involved in cell wall biosynthesis|uniref:Colanic acid biosynthesis glycosyltransferase WcaL n=1 Tax=Desulfobacca acetoxidans TaxID=60893 RepID=A0A7C3V1W6_9BACT
MNSPRIAYILLWFPEPTQTFILDEVNTMAGLGLDLTVYTLYGPRPASRVAGMAKVKTPVHHLGVASARQVLHSLARLSKDFGPEAPALLRRVWVRRWRSPETAGEALWAALGGVHLAGRFQADGINHIHAPWANGPATAAWVASSLTGIPFSFCAHAHDIYPPDGALQEKLVAASFVRTISHANRRYLTGLVPEAAAKIVHLTYGAPLTSEPRQPWTPNPPFRLLALGRLVEKKGFPVLLAACRHLMEWGVDFHLTLAGDGPERRRLMGLVQEYALGDRVTFLGHVPHNKVPELFRQADQFIMPCVVARQGDRDGLPNVILEALAFQVPVVATDVNGVNEAIIPGKTGWLVPPQQPRLLAQAMREALYQPEEAQRRAEQGRELVRREFDSTTNYARLKACLEKAAGPSAAG